MHWLNEPAHWQAHDDEILVTADPHTDFWRTTHYGFIRDSGHLYHQAATGDFQLDVEVRGRYAAPRDQAGLMLRMGYDNDSFILGPQGCSSHASSEKRTFFWYRSLLFPTNLIGAVLTPVAIP